MLTLRSSVFRRRAEFSLKFMNPASDIDALFGDTVRSRHKEGDGNDIHF